MKQVIKTERNDDCDQVMTPTEMTTAFSSDVSHFLVVAVKSQMGDIGGKCWVGVKIAPYVCFRMNAPFIDSRREVFSSSPSKAR